MGRMVQAKNITKHYGQLQVLKGVDLTVEKGEIVSIVGASGAGKTTLLQILGTLDRMDQGSLSINGINPFDLNAKALAQFRNESLGFIFQFHQLLPEFSAIENVCFPALIQNQSMSKAKIRAKELLDYLSLSHRFDHKPGALSGGEQQRVAVARALMNQPALILADEPSGNLDTQNAQELHQLFFDLRKAFNQTFIIVTHNSDLAQMADRQLVMENGNFKP
jgi:lipoprotein-releasing system ATP-binding protein